MNVFRSIGSVALLSAGLVLCCDPGGQGPSEEEQVWEGPTGKSTDPVCEEGETLFNGECLVPAAIKLNTVGYLPERIKLATIPATDGVTEFVVRNVGTNEVAYSGTVGAAQTNADTGDVTSLLDFTELAVEGRYRIEVAGLSDSPEFEIGASVFVAPLKAGMLGFYGQRCGVAISFDYNDTHFEHDACHLDDALTLAGEKRDGTGGWHDAGDYGKYTVNAAFTVAFLLKAWEDFGAGLAGISHIPGYGGAWPAWLDEARFQLDQLEKMQLSDGSASHMIGPPQFPGFIMPERDITERRFTGNGTIATADLAAVSALAARVLQPIDADYAERFLSIALRAEAFLDEHPEAIVPSFEGFTHSAYRGNSEADDRFWAKVELWRVTGDDARLTEIEANMPASLPINWDWDGVNALGVFDYVSADSDARDAAVLASARELVVTSADTIVANVAEHAYGRGVGDMYYWGINGVMARSVMNLVEANAVAPSDAYWDAAVQQVDYLFGRNPFGRSFVTGVGYFPANHPHHRPSAADRIGWAWPGLLVGGPNHQNHPKADKNPDLAIGLFWWDEQDDYNSNEVAINWNAALVYALAALVPE